jgi:hypothetical protein
MRQLDSGNGNGGIVERLETGHRGAAALDRAMVLLNYVLGGPVADPSVIEHRDGIL